MSGQESMTTQVWPPFWRPNIRPTGWSRFRIGPMCVSFHRHRLDRHWHWASPSWRYINVDGEARHARSLRRWWRAPKRRPFWWEVWR